MSISLTYTGGNQSYDVTNASKTAIYVTISKESSGSFLAYADQTASPITMNIKADPSASVLINPGDVNYSTVSIYNLGHNSPVILNRARLSYNISGASTEDKAQAFLNSTNVAGGAALTNTVLVMNGDNTPSSFTVVDRGGNVVWAGANTLNVLSATLETTPTSQIIAGKTTGTINIDDNTPSYTPQKMSAVDIVLNAIQGANTGLYYNITQNSWRHANIFQESGNITFSGQNTTLVLNHGNAQGLLTLSGDTELWNGDGNSYITTTGYANKIISSGKGDLLINNATAASDPSSTTDKGTIDIIAMTDSSEQGHAGKIVYIQGQEDAHIHGTISNFTGQLGAGNTTIDLAGVSSLNSFLLTLGTGNLILENFTKLSTADQQKLEAGLHTNQNSKAISVNYSSETNNTVFSINNGPNITFQNYNATSLADKIFS